MNEAGQLPVPAVAAGWLAPGGAADGRMRGWLRWAGPLVSIAVVVVAANAFRGTDLAAIAALVPTQPAFWLVFVAAYFAQPLGDYVIFRRLWRIPPAGFAALTRKLISNELLFGYSGELYFYAWARRRSAMVGAPFGAIKDVAILSALVGNAVTLVVFAFAWPTLAALDIGIAGRTFVTSIAVVVASSVVIMAFRGRVFSLPRRDLGFVAAVQLFRVIATTGAAALMWSLVMPDVALSWWLLLAALRLLISRLPLIPNKDVVFAGAAVLIVGAGAGIAPLMAMMAAVTLGAHLLVGSLLVALDLSGVEERA